MSLYPNRMLITILAQEPFQPPPSSPLGLKRFSEEDLVFGKINGFPKEDKRRRFLGQYRQARQDEADPTNRLRWAVLGGAFPDVFFPRILSSYKNKQQCLNVVFACACLFACFP